jgi:uncharacterized protein YjgD (DUF1641 family)
MKEYIFKPTGEKVQKREYISIPKGTQINCKCIVRLTPGFINLNTDLFEEVTDETKSNTASTEETIISIRKLVSWVKEYKESDKINEAVKQACYIVDKYAEFYREVQKNKKEGENVKIKSKSSFPEDKAPSDKETADYLKKLKENEILKKCKKLYPLDYYENKLIEEYITKQNPTNLSDLLNDIQNLKS